MSVRVGTTPGAANVLVDTEVFPESDVVTRSGLSIPTFNTFQARYTNGAGVTTTQTRAVIPVAEDAYVRDGSFAGTNFGSEQGLIVKLNGVGSNRRSYMKIDTTAIPGAASKVVLRFAAYKSPNVTPVTRLEFVPTTSGWSQSAITWNNAPAATGSPIAAVDLSNTANTWFEIDITAYVAAERAAGRPIVSLLVRSPSVSDGGAILSRELAPYAPQVIVTTQG
jgi:hypothetical protein